jgi:DNA primase
VICGRYPYLGINLSKLYATAWCCGYIPLPRVLSELTGVSQAECKTLIGEQTRLWQPEREKHKGVLQLPTGLCKLLPTQWNYLRSRGFDPVELERLWGVKGIGGLGGSLAWRIFIPVHLHGEIVSWTTRRITNVEPRYLSAAANQSAVPIQNLLYGQDYVRHAMVIVEGPVDCWRIGPGAVALLGLRTTARQIQAMAEIPLRVFAFDAEPEAQRRAEALARALSVFPGKSVIVRLESGKDAASCDPREIQELRKRFLS